MGRSHNRCFNTITPKIANQQEETAKAMVCIVADVFITALLVGVMIAIIKSYKKYQSAVKVPDKMRDTNKRAIEDKCDYCGGIYAIGAHNTCPHCGAALTSHYEDGTRVKDPYAGLDKKTFKG